MTVRVNKPAFNLREKLSELTSKFGLKGTELARAETVQDARDLISAGRKNLIINGRFDIWQRGTSFTGDEYTADRWSQTRSSGTATISRQSFTLGQTEVPGNPVYYLQQSCSIGNGNCGFNQPIEDVRNGAGGPVTVSFWAKGTNPPGYGYWAMQLWQRFGTGGSPSGAVQNNKELRVTADWKKYIFTYELASLTGKTLGTDGTDRVDLLIRQHQDDNNTGTWQLSIANVQVELGKNATEFEHRSYGEELALCQRYCFRVDGNAFDETALGSGQIRSTSSAQGYITLPVTMRDHSQSITESEMSCISGGSGSVNVSLTSSFDEGKNCVGVNLDTDSGSPLVVGRGAIVRLNASTSAFFQVESEL